MKNNFIKSTIILVIAGIITKALGMVIKIALTRAISTRGIGLYSLILPTFNLFITLCSMGMPLAISKLISEHKHSNKKIVLSIIPIIIIFNIFLMVILFVTAPIISKYLLKTHITYYPLMAIGITLPFISLSSILKGYFFGKENMLASSLANIVEQLVRLTLTMYLIPRLMKYGFSTAITGVVLLNVVSEFSSILILLLFIPRNVKIKISDFKYDEVLLKDVMSISIPSTGSRLIGALSSFLEPIILTHILGMVGYSSDFITIEYGIINGYVYPLLLMPSFFTFAISNALMPIVSNHYSNRDYKYTKYKIKQAIILSLIIGIPCTLLFMRMPEVFLDLIYNTGEGVIYIKMIAPIFILHYIQAPLTASMQGMGLAREAMMGTLIGAIIKTILIFVLSMFKIGLWGLLIGSMVNIIVVTVHHLYYVFNKLEY